MLELYINFKGEAKEAIAFYEDVFDTKCQNLMTFGEAPEDPEHPINDEMKDLVMNASIIIEGTYVMISDVPDMFGFEVTEGNNLSLVVSTDDDEKIDRLFKRLSEGGTVTMPLFETFWSKKYGSLKDQFGIHWMFNYYEED
ncbi:PhnB protein [Enterococcus sp. AZ107]